MKIEIDLTEKPNLLKLLKNRARTNKMQIDDVITMTLYRGFDIKPEYKTYIDNKIGIRVVELPFPVISTRRERKRKPSDNK